jgi:hypothetical protein
MHSVGVYVQCVYSVGVYASMCRGLCVCVCVCVCVRVCVRAINSKHTHTYTLCTHTHCIHTKGDLTDETDDRISLVSLV